MLNSSYIDTPAGRCVRALQARELAEPIPLPNGVVRAHAEALDRTVLLRIAGTLEFLTNNLPPACLPKLQG